MLSDTAEFAASVESLMRQTLGVPLDAEVCFLLFCGVNNFLSKMINSFYF